jgi:hypothetical protein
VPSSILRKNGEPDQMFPDAESVLDYERLARANVARFGPLGSPTGPIPLALKNPGNNHTVPAILLENDQRRRLIPFDPSDSFLEVADATLAIWMYH